MHVLMIEDDLDLGRALQAALKLEGISSEWRRRLVDAPRSFAQENFDCVLLDLSLPDGEGMSLLQQWRSQSCAIPVIVITARDGLQERLAGLDGGADDFLLKPFAPAELVSRIRAVLRRCAKQASDVWHFNGMEIEPRSHTVRADGETLTLSPREFQLLLELAREAGQVVVKGDLAQRLQPLGEAVDFGAIEVHIFNLRRKLGADRIKTIRGVGYMLVS